MNHVKIIAHPSIISLEAAALALVKRHFCPESASRDICLCTTCVAINEKRFPGMAWVPKKSTYSRENIEHIHALAAHKRAETETLFCILENPEFLHPSAANSLLKTLEEPPSGMIFVFLSQNLKSVLPTIASRATITLLDAEDATSAQASHELVTMFVGLCLGTRPTGAQLESLLQKKCPDSTQSMQFFDEIIATLRHENASPQIFDMLFWLRAQPPAPGSSKLFWRTAFLNLVNCG